MCKKYNNRRLNGRERADANKNKLKQTTKRWKRRNFYLAFDILIKFPFPKLFHNCCNICPSLIWIIIIFKKIYRFSIIVLLFTWNKLAELLFSFSANHASEDRLLNHSYKRSTLYNFIIHKNIFVRPGLLSTISWKVDKLLEKANLIVATKAGRLLIPGNFFWRLENNFLWFWKNRGLTV